MFITWRGHLSGKKKFARRWTHVFKFHNVFIIIIKFNGLEMWVQHKRVDVNYWRKKNPKNRSLEEFYRSAYLATIFIPNSPSNSVVSYRWGTQLQTSTQCLYKSKWLIETNIYYFSLKQMFFLGNWNLSCFSSMFQCLYVAKERYLMIKKIVNQKVGKQTIGKQLIQTSCIIIRVLILKWVQREVEPFVIMQL